MSTRPVTLAIVGATGLAGRAALELLPEVELDPAELRLLASGKAREEGERLEYLDDELPVRPVSQSAFQGADVALFFVPPAVAREWAPRAWADGCAVVDDSPAFRGEPDVPLVVPEVNGAEVAGYRARGIVASPCSIATALSLALAPLVEPVGRDR